MNNRRCRAMEEELEEFELNEKDRIELLTTNQDFSFINDDYIEKYSKT